MSRVGNNPIAIPSGVKVNIEQNEVTVSGPKGELHRRFHSDMSIKEDSGKLIISRPSDDKLHRSLHGLTRALLANMVHGVVTGFEKELEIVGVGYRVEKRADKIAIRIGFSHPVEVTPLLGTSFEIEGTTHIKVKGIDKEKVNEMAAEIRAIRLPESYKGKGIKYAGEVVRHKAGKAGKAIGQKE